MKGLSFEKKLILYFILILFFILLFPYLTLGSKKKEVVFISEKNLPRKIAIFGPFSLKKKNIDISAFGLVKNVIKNYMAGKGYVVVHVDSTLSKWDPDFKEIKRIYKNNPDIDGVLVIGVHQLSKFNIAFAQYYKMDGELCLYNKKKKLGCWREAATRKKVSIATDPLGAIATLVSSVISSSGNVYIKNTIFEWAFKISSLIPSFSSVAKKPKIFRVVSNITDKPFKIGDKILVGIEGSHGGSAYFTISPLINKVVMSEVQNGIYKGMYVVKEGDKLTNGVLHVTLENDRGEKRDWLEDSPLVNIDGIPPSLPSSFSATPTKSSIRLGWNTTDSEVVGFILLRSENPLSGYKKIAEVKSFSYEDKDVKEGKQYFYRLIALDKVGNTSKPAQVGPVSLPIFTQRPMPEVIVSDLPSGKYYLKGTCTIPLGSNVTLENSKIEFRPGSILKVEGNLVLNSVFINFNKSFEKKDIKKQIKAGPEIKSDNKDNKSIKNEGNKSSKLLKEKKDTIPPTSGIVVVNTGNLNMKGSQLSGLSEGVLVKGAMKGKDFSILNSDKGIVVDTLKEVNLVGGTFKSLKQAVVVKNGKAEIKECKFEDNVVAVDIKGGEVKISQNNFINNKINISSDIKIILKKNFFGSKKFSDLKIKGKAEVFSFLDSPYPGGQEIKVQNLIKEAKQDKQKAMEFLNKRDYGKAVELFKKVIEVIPDVDTYIYYIYALSMINDKSIENVIEEAINKYPYEAKLYQLGIRYYIQANKNDRARTLLKKGLKLNPDDSSLTSMSYYFKDINSKQEAKDDKDVKEQGNDKTKKER